MGLNVADAKVQHCQTAADVRALARAVIERKRARRTRRIPINDLTPGSFPMVVNEIHAPEPVEEIVFETIEEAKHEAPESIKCPTIAFIIDLVCATYGVAKMDLLSQRRTADVVLPRQIAQALAARLTPHSLLTIGKHFGGRDHTTILHAKQKIIRERAADPALDAKLSALEMRLGGYNPQIKTHAKPLDWSPAMDARLKALIATSKTWKAITKTMERDFEIRMPPTSCYGRMYTLGLRRPKIKRTYNMAAA